MKHCGKINNTFAQFILSVKVVQRFHNYSFCPKGLQTSKGNLWDLHTKILGKKQADGRYLSNLEGVFRWSKMQLLRSNILVQALEV